MSNDMGTNVDFDAIVANIYGLSHHERIVGICYDFQNTDECNMAGVAYMNERANAQDLFFPNVFDALQANPDFHIFLANFLEQQPDARVFIGLDLNYADVSREVFNQFVVAKTRLCSDYRLPAIDASLIFFGGDEDYEFDDDDENEQEDEEAFSEDLVVLTAEGTVWERFGNMTKVALIVKGIDVTTSVLTRIVLDGTTPLLRILVATHPQVTTGLLKGVLEQADPDEYHLFDIVYDHDLANDEVMQLLETLNDE